MSPSVETIPLGMVPPSIGAVVAGTSETDLVGMGSAVLCAPGIALTATHVLDEMFKQFDGRPPQVGCGSMKFGIHVGTRAPTGEWLKWQVRGYAIHRPLDIAALILSPAEENLLADWPQPTRLSARFPDVGQPIIAFGFPGSAHRMNPDGSASILLTPTDSVGRVREIYPEWRDKGMLPFPSIRSDAAFPAGISGGPVCDRLGRVFAIVCSDLPALGPDEEHASFASLLWPALGLYIATEPVTGKPMPETRLLELARSGQLHVDDHDWVEHVQNGSLESMRIRIPRGIASAKAG